MAKPEKLIEARNLGGELGHLFISERALQMIVYGALLEVDGLYAPDRVKGAGLLDSISKAAQGMGIQILKAPPAGRAPQSAARREAQQNEPTRKLRVKVSLFAQFGSSIHESSDQAIQKIRTKVRELAGLEVEDVEVEISGIVKL